MKRLLTVIENYLDAINSTDRVIKEYPAGTCNAEDALREAAKNETEAREILDKVIAAYKEAGL